MRTRFLASFLLIGMFTSAAYAYAPPDSLHLAPLARSLRFNESVAVYVEPNADLSPQWTYEWSITRGAGSISGNGSIVVYNAPASGSPDWVVVRVVVKQSGTPLVTRFAALLLYKQFIILKADDLERAFWLQGGLSDNWKYYLDYMADTRHVKTSAGIISRALDPTYPASSGNYHYAEFVAYTLLKQNTGYVEYWNHGYDHSSGSGWYEFYGTTYAWQTAHLGSGETFSRTCYGKAFAAFGAPFNQIDATATTVVDESADVKVWLFGDSQDTNKMVLSEGNGYIEPTSGQPSFSFFQSTYNPAAPYVVMQHHPDFATFRTDFDQYVQILDYLQGQQATFLLPSEYYNLIQQGIFPLDPQADSDGDTVLDVVEGLGDSSNDGLPDFLDPGNVQPTITAQPVSQTVNPGAEATFSVGVSGPGPLSYQWKKNASPISGATVNPYVIAAAEQSDEASFTVEVSNAAGSATSNPATLTVDDPPAIIVQPVSHTVNPGGNASFFVTATGTPPLSYEWRKNGATLSGATQSSCAVLAAVESDEGIYTCYVSNAAGTASGQNQLSDPADLSVNNPPEVVNDPTAVTVDFGASVQFSVVATGTGPLSYQWRHNAGNLTNATASTFTLVSAANTSEGGYDCVVSNVAGTDTSNAALLTVRDPIITTQPLGLVLLAGSTAAFHVGATGSGTLGYQWYKDGTALSDSGDISGSASPGLDIANVENSDSGGYYCSVQGGDGAVASDVASLIVSDPAINTHPVSQTVDPDDPVQFSVIAAGTGPFSYQWLKGASPISGATEATYTIPQAAESDEGQYVCVVTNALPPPNGTATSNAATLSVNDPPTVGVQPQSQSIDPTDPVTFTLALAQGTLPVVYQWKKNGSSLSGATESSYHIAGVAESDEGTYTCHVGNSAGQTETDGAVLEVNNAPVITEQPVSLTVNPGIPAAFSIAAISSTPLSYQWRKNGMDLPGKTLSTCAIAAAAQSDEGGYTCLVSNSAGAKTFSNPESTPATLTVNDPPMVVDQPDSRIVAPGYSVTFSIQVSGMPPFSYQWRKGASDISDATNASYTISAVTLDDAGSYLCQVTNSIGETLSEAALLTVFDPARIVSQPVSQTVSYGATVGFSAPATGTPLLYYQWKKNGVDLSDGGRISGSEEATLQIANAEDADEGEYECQASNMFGAILSDPAHLTVHDPALLMQPADQVVFLNHPAAFSVAGVGSALTFQWFRNTGPGFVPLSDGGNISGAHLSTLTVSNCQVADEGAYHCVLGGGADPDVTSQAAILALGDPAIQANPQSLTVDPGDPAALSLTLDSASTPPITYQWRKNGVNISGATGLVTSGNLHDPVTYAVAAATEDDQGEYVCALHGAEDVTSGMATIMVNDPPVIAAVVVTPPSGMIHLLNSASLTAQVAAGTPPLNYQWKKDGVNVVENARVTGSHVPTLTISLAEQSEEGWYVCEVSNSAGTAVSIPVHLIVGELLTFTQPMNDQKKYVGQDIRFALHLTGGLDPIHYQWKFNDGRKTSVPRGADAPILEIPQATTADAGQYWCDVTDARGGYTSNTALLEIAAAFEIAQHPQSGQGIPGHSFSFSVETRGGFDPVTYEWKKRGVPATLGAGATYDISSVQPEDAGTYYVVVSDSNGSALQSEDAVLTVSAALPVATILGLGLAAGACFLAGTIAIRRKS